MDRTGSVEPSDKVLCKQKFSANAVGLGSRLIHLTTEAYLIVKYIFTTKHSVLNMLNCKSLLNNKLVFIILQF